ncbi:hypothetical protein KL910_001288 [Ogataea haglerorum]|nr:hypothetical protein KL945_003756 [Ogataea haglerorum]KAG7791907.1 hypothetical protein KL910_001288 [Ogataea haglerorum]
MSLTRLFSTTRQARTFPSAVQSLLARHSIDTHGGQRRPAGPAGSRKSARLVLRCRPDGQVAASGQPAAADGSSALQSPGTQHYSLGWRSHRDGGRSVGENDGAGADGAARAAGQRGAHPGAVRALFPQRPALRGQSQPPPRQLSRRGFCAQQLRLVERYGVSGVSGQVRPVCESEPDAFAGLGEEQTGVRARHRFQRVLVPAAAGLRFLLLEQKPRRRRSGGRERPVRQHCCGTGSDRQDASGREEKSVWCHGAAADDRERRQVRQERRQRRLHRQQPHAVVPAVPVSVQHAGRGRSEAAVQVLAAAGGADRADLQLSPAEPGAAAGPARARRGDVRPPPRRRRGPREPGDQRRSVRGRRRRRRRGSGRVPPTEHDHGGARGRASQRGGSAAQKAARRVEKGDQAAARRRRRVCRQAARPAEPVGRRRRQKPCCRRPAAAHPDGQARPRV